jgi:hypothetical protein
MSGIINISDGTKEELIPLSANSQTKGQGYAGSPSEILGLKMMDQNDGFSYHGKR